MKYRTDFVTNSSSTSFAAAAGSVIAALLAAFGLGSCTPDRENDEGSGASEAGGEEQEFEGYSLQVSPGLLTLRPGASAVLNIAVYQSGEDGEAIAEDAQVTVSAASGDLSLSPEEGQGEFGVTVDAADDAAPGTHSITVSAAVGDKKLTKTVSVEVEAAVELELTYPVGRSPRVFIRGWVFGARCIANAGTDQEQDLSDTVRWSGTGSFEPEVGSQSHPSFAAPGSNTIRLTCQVGDAVIEKEFTVEAVSTANYARQGDLAKVPADAHGCPACPHVAVGPIISGSSLVLIDGKPAARVGDAGVHAACCGANKYTIIGGDPMVLIEGRRAAKIGDATQHCGGVGSIIQGSPGG